MTVFLLYHFEIKLMRSISACQLDGNIVKPVEQSRVHLCSNALIGNYGNYHLIFYASPTAQMRDL
jgi:hypothetical protein